MSASDRFCRSLFVACAVGLAWGIRGSFGHVVGAMYPGAVLAMGFCFVSGQKSMFRWMPILAGLTAILIGQGGRMSYGILHGYAKSDTLVNYSYGFLTLLLQGGCWGVFAGAVFGLVLERVRMTMEEWIRLIISVLAIGWVTYAIVVDLLGFHINPPRSDLSIGFIGGAIGLFVWLIKHKRYHGIKGGVLAFVGFGLGMTIGRLLDNLSRLLPEGLDINGWSVMETSCGFIGGFIFTWGMLGPKFPEPAVGNRFFLLSSNFGAVIALGAIPYLHRILRMPWEEFPAQVTRRAAKQGIETPEGFVETMFACMNGYCIAAFVGVGVWMWIHERDRIRMGWLPVLWLSSVMLLMQATHVFYFFTPAREGYLNMDSILWILFFAMILFVLVYRVGETDVGDIEAKHGMTPWIVGTIGVFILLIVLSSFINGESTMSSANTRWPSWSWREGPFPGR